ncbi:VWA domain-containing protein [Halostella sp. JP-L12]|uniref:DUF7289 family protein n=1 Tax=Halostella TaxID=1843185 RepID=UPI000EF804C9|nr:MULTISPECIES: VWA domain-containing protein [Halostella]NHN49541.1 VWA domain-containing protein [Halostella sp. JP-L12]
MTDGSSWVGASEDRGASNVLGLTILFGLVFLGATLVFLAGGMAVEELKQENDARSAEMSMQEVRSDIASLSSRGEGSTELQVDDGVSIVADGEMAFTVHGWTDDRTYRSDCTTNMPLSAFEYQNDNGERVAYQGGGVWKRTNGGSTMVSPPALSYRSEEIEGEEYRTFDFSVENLTGRIDDAGETTASVNRTRSRERQAAIEREMFCRDDGDGNVTRVRSLEIVVRNSTYYDAWGRYFEAQMGDVGDVTVYDGNRTVVVSDLPLGRTDLSIGNGVPLLEATPNTNDSQANHRLRYRVGEDLAGESLDEVEIRYRDGEVDFVRAWNGGGGSRGHINFDASEVRSTNGTTDINSSIVDSVSVSEGSTPTVTVRFDGTVTLEENDVVVVEYGHNGDRSSSKVKNPSSPGRYNVTASVVDERRDGYLTILTDAASDSPYADADSDGVPDHADECEGVSGGGDNGCGAISADEDANALVVNSSSGTIELVGTQIGEERTVNETLAEREPLDVMFVLDRSGSMGPQYKPDRWRVPEYARCSWDESGEWEDSEATDIEWGAVNGNEYVVPSGLRVYHRSDYYYQGETLSLSPDTSVWTQTGELEGCYREGNDPDNQRIDATRSFIGALDANNDSVGAVEFNSRSYLQQSLTQNFTATNQSLTPAAVGGTNISAGLESAIDQHEARPDGEDVIVLLSDGENDPESLNDNTNRSVQRAIDENITIYTVGLGDGVDDSLLQYWANETGGDYYGVDDADGLEDIFDQIAGDVTNDSVRAVEHKTVQAQVQIGGDTYALDPSAADGPVDPDGSASAINDPTDNGSLAFAVDGIDVGSLLSFSARSVDCAGASETGLESEHDNETYAHTTCNGTTGTIDSADNSSDSDHRIFRDGDDLPTISTAWWQAGIESVLDDDLHSGGEFDLGDDQAIILVELDSANGSHTDYAVFLYDADTDNGYSGGPPDDGEEASSDNRYVIDISPTQVEIGDDE